MEKEENGQVFINFKASVWKKKRWSKVVTVHATDQVPIEETKKHTEK